MAPLSAPSPVSSTRIFVAMAAEMTPPSWSAEPRPKRRWSHSDSGGVQPSSFLRNSLLSFALSTRPSKQSAPTTFSFHWERRGLTVSVWPSM